MKDLTTMVSGVSVIIGILLLLQSPTLGLIAANSWLRGIGGRIDTSQFSAMLTGYIEAYRLLGAILFGFGLFWAFQQMRESTGRKTELG